MAHSEDMVLGCKLGNVHLRHRSPDAFSEGADAKGWSDAASSTKGHSLTKMSRKRGMAGVFSALRLQGVLCPPE